jgi:pimeloyl-ACP methyl ester carboxylesterase
VFLPKKNFKIAGSVMSTADTGSGPVLLLGHGWLCDGAMWASQVKAWSTSYRVIVPDMWGHGLSGTLPDGTRSLSEVAEHHIELLDHLGVEQATVIGFSLGGMWGAELALRAPERVSALVILASSLAAEPEESRTSFLAAVDVMAGPNGIQEDLADGLLSLLYSTDFRLRHPDIVELHRARLVAWPRDQLRDTVASIGRMIFNRREALDDMRALAMPILSISGAEDQAMPPARVARMAEAIGSPFVEVPFVGHMLTQEAPVVINRAILDFLANASANPNQFRSRPVSSGTR